MEQNEITLPAEGSIADVFHRLEIWCNRASQGLSRVEFFSEFARHHVIDRLQNSLKDTGIPFIEIQLPSDETPSNFVRILREKLYTIAAGVVSITGFPNPLISPYPIEDFLRALNFNRENIAKNSICQIWWISSIYLENLIHVAPDLDSWFVLRLQLTETIMPSFEFQSLMQPLDRPTTNINEARKRSKFLKERFINALEQHVPSNVLLEQIVLPAITILHDAGAEQEVKELTAWMLNQLSESDLQNENTLKEDSQKIIDNLSNLASIYKSQGDYHKAELLTKEALSISKKYMGEESPIVATFLNNIAVIMREQGKNTQAESLLLKALAIHEKTLGPDHPYLAIDLDNLAESYREQGKYLEAEPLYKRSIMINSKVYGSNHPNLANDLNNIALLYYSQGKYTEAATLFQKAIAIYENNFGQDHPFFATSLNNLALLNYKQGKYTEAEQFYQRALAIHENTMGSNHLSVAADLNNLAGLYYSQHKYTAAEPLYKQGIMILEKKLTERSSQPCRCLP